MKVTTPEISWHERDPIYSVDIQPGNRKIKRLVSGGVDKFVRIWQIVFDKEGKAEVEFLANLKRHTKAVNVCRFSPDGETLATAGDDSVIIIWHLSESTGGGNNIFQEDEEDNKENWAMQKCLRGHLEDIYDLCWSSNMKYMVSGSVDNTAILWDLAKDQKLALFNEHKSFVQGVSLDPREELIATMSTDRACRVFNLATRNCTHTISRMTLPPRPTPSPTSDTGDNSDTKENKPKSFRMFHDDTMRSFFRRLTFTPDGELLIVPAGLVEADPVTNATFIFTRNNLSKPALYLPSPDKVTIAVRCCPIKFELRKVPREVSQDNQNDDMKEWEKYETLFCLPYRQVFAVATEDSIQLYDTQQAQPFAFITNIHYHQLSDLTWSSDGRILVVSSTDGYCTMATFEEGELGIPYIEEKGSVGVTEGVSVDLDTTQDSAMNTSQEEVAMEMEPGSEDLRLVLDTSSDALEATSEAEDQVAFTSPKPAMTMRVKSADGKPKNVQITTLSSVTGASGGPKSPAMKVRSADGKVKNVQIETLASYTSPKSKGCNSSSRSEDSKSAKSGVLKEKSAANNDSDSSAVNVTSSLTTETEISDKNTPVKMQVKSADGKPKRVQIQTLQLFNSPKGVSDQTKDKP